MVDMLKLQVISNISACVHSKNSTLMESGPEDILGGGGGYLLVPQILHISIFYKEKKGQFNYLNTVYFKQNLGKEQVL
jgi:hypothetical protein